MPAAVSTRLAARRPIAHPPTAGRLRRALATRVLILSWEYPPIVEGGLARHVAKLAEALVAEGVAVTVLTRGRVRDLPQEVRAGVRVHRVPEPRKPARPRRVRGVGRGHGPGHARRRARARAQGHVRRRPRPRLARRLGRGAPRRTSSSCPTSRRSTPPSTAATRAGSTSTRRPTSTASRPGWPSAPTGSSSARPTCATTWPTSSVSRTGAWRSIPNGIDPADLGCVDDLDALRARFAAPEDKLVLLVGRLVYEKGFQLALDALKPVIARVGGVRFLVAGSGTARGRAQGAGPAPGARRGTARSWAGSATTSCTRSTASPT